MLHFSVPHFKKKRRSLIRKLAGQANIQSFMPSGGVKIEMRAKIDGGVANEGTRASKRFFRAQYKQVLESRQK